LKKLFISQPMHGKTNEQIKAERVFPLPWPKKHFGKSLRLLTLFLKMLQLMLRRCGSLQKALNCYLLRMQCFLHVGGKQRAAASSSICAQSNMVCT